MQKVGIRAASLAVASLVILVVLVSVGCGRHANAARRGRIAATAAPIPTAVARRTTIDPTLAIAGIIAPLQNVAISSSLSEPTEGVYVNEGDRVRRGQLLALLDTTDLRANLAAQQSVVASDEARVRQSQYTAQLSYAQNPDQITQARAALRSAQSTLAQGRLDLARYRSLVTSGYISSQQYAQQVTTTQTQEASVRSAEAALSSAISNARVNGDPGHGLQAANVASSVADVGSARAQIDQIRAQIARARIVSPVDGVIVNRNINVGEYPGSRTSFTIQELSSVYAELNASSADVFRIHAGAPTKIVAGADVTGHVYQGAVVAILGQVQPGATNFTVKVLVSNPGSVLQSGIPVTGTISLGATTGIGIPSGAFLDDTNSSVLAVRSGKARTAAVRVIATDGTTAIVSGLDAGMRVVANGQLGITPGQDLNPSPEPSGAGARRGSRGGGMRP